MATTNSYQRYHIDTIPTPDFVPWPNKFDVKVNRPQLAKLLISEIIHLKGDMKAVTSRPCMYGTFSGPIGGFAPRPEHCVGCLGCSGLHPKMGTITRDVERGRLGGSYFTSAYGGAGSYEADNVGVPA
ncbi:MAG: hypothetical protein H8D34_10985 [Chloroflexi bacterium]|nr:hypothetical protein [Chloroflexota bacterium]